MIKQIINNTQKYIDSFPKEERKSIGQFFTSLETARYMASFVKPKENLKILDVGAGTGILTAAVVEKLIRSRKVEQIEFTLYENDSNVIATLNDNLDIIERCCTDKNIKFVVNIVNENFITHNSTTWESEQIQGEFDIVISNPPYKKIGKEDDEAVVMQNIVYGQPNIYYLCMAMGLKMLKPCGQYIYIVPRSWTSGLYFRKFREFFLENISIKQMHLFVSRDKVFDNETVLQETMIVYGTKEKRQKNKIKITTNSGTKDFNEITKISVNAKVCIGEGENLFVLLPTNNEDVEVLNKISMFTNTLRTEGFIFKTGQVVEFRNLSLVSNEAKSDNIPLIRPFHFTNDYIKFPIKTLKNQYIQIKENKNMYLDSKNLLLLKRFTTKEEKRRLQPAICFSRALGYNKIAVENHVNYLENVNRDISIDEIYGFWAIFKSELWDRYYRILNGSTQVNATEINTMPIPNIVQIKRLGEKVRISSADTDIDELIEEMLYGKD